VINKMKAWQGSLGISPCDGLVSPAYYVFDFSISNRRYGEALLRSRPYVDRFGAASDGVRVGQWDLSVPALREMPVLLPEEAEQAGIVKFLDHANVRIGRAIAAKRKMVALLEEQKSAIVHQAVMEGLELTVDCRSSSSDWFPALPAGWDVTTLGRLITSAIDGPHFSPDYLDEGVPFLSARNVKRDRWNLADVKYISQQDYELFNRRVKPEFGDVLYTKGGTTGVARVVDLTFSFQVWVHVAVLKLHRQLVDPEYLAMTLNSPRCYEQSQLYTRGATNQDLGLSRMKRIELPLPRSLDEQRRVVQRVRRQTDDLVTAETRLIREIELLREFRTRLTADVVTGQLDVREAATKLPDLDPADLTTVDINDLDAVVEEFLDEAEP
ncbi:MAG: restriction endonuclease subunit S, partial [Acidobacteria bacterium]|nr:restriction endonuclease subunit S [Acidobacteriota bacterium]